MDDSTEPGESHAAEDLGQTALSRFVREARAADLNGSDKAAEADGEAHHHPPPAPGVPGQDVFLVAAAEVADMGADDPPDDARIDTLQGAMALAEDPERFGPVLPDGERTAGVVSGDDDGGRVARCGRH